MLLRFQASSTDPIYLLSLHDALPIFFRNDYVPSVMSYDPYFRGERSSASIAPQHKRSDTYRDRTARRLLWIRWYVCDKDRKSTRLNSSHVAISYAVFCLKKKIQQQT